MLARDDFDRLVTVILDRLHDAMVSEVRREVDSESLAYRRATCVWDQWCCTTMRSFATQTWGASSPRPAYGFGTVSYALKGEVVNFCPFCGAALGRKGK